ncbi:glycosyltransferase [uncultured Pontibacter sp.]|uniref:glycosyltransferase family 4 protein n=1 Tax=uncultured Pontibacter sp. TaxID=453356 RepID=UPI00261B35EB|nr:glycosyltransferase [uncultured Pontibacter sp.]
MKSIAIICSGLDDVRRGYETHALDLFNVLKKEPSHLMDVFLIKRSGVVSDNHIVTGTPGRNSWIVKKLSKLRGSPLYWESFFVALWTLLFIVVKKKKFETIYCQELIVCKVLRMFKNLSLVKSKIVFGHGVWMEPTDYVNSADVIHEVNIENFNKSKHFKHDVILTPHFLLSSDIKRTNNHRNLLRDFYDFHAENIILSVGRIDFDHKRMDYLINEVARLDQSWGLIICGIGEQSILDKGNFLLGKRFLNLFLDRSNLEEIYSLADVFVLCSLNEGFGIVTIEAMSQGLPVILHDRELFRWILKDSRYCVDMSKDGNLSNFILNNNEDFVRTGKRNREIFLQNYSWCAVKTGYLNMLH